VSFLDIPQDRKVDLPWKTVAEAKRLMRPTYRGAPGLDLYQAAYVLRVRPRDLDQALWKNIGSAW